MLHTTRKRDPASALWRANGGTLLAAHACWMSTKLIGKIAPVTIGDYNLM